MGKSTSLKALFIILTAVIAAYTGYVISTEGLGLFQVFIADIIALNWSGQFNLDFSLYLLLSALWIMWRSKFDTASIIIGLVAGVLGMVIFAPYFYYLLSRENGDLKRVLLGKWL